MKRKTLVVGLVFAFISIGIWVMAQGGKQSDETQKNVYCLISGNQRPFSTKVVVSVDYGEEKGMWYDPRIRDEETGKVQKFNSMVDALNYMENQGWDFVDAYAVTVSNQNAYHWLLRKKITAQ